MGRQRKSRTADDLMDLVARLGGLKSEVQHPLK